MPKEAHYVLDGTRIDTVKDC